MEEFIRKSIDQLKEHHVEILHHVLGLGNPAHSPDDVLVKHFTENPADLFIIS